MSNKLKMQIESRQKFVTCSQQAIMKEIDYFFSLLRFRSLSVQAKKFSCKALLVGETFAERLG